MLITTPKCMKFAGFTMFLFLKSQLDLVHGLGAPKQEPNWRTERELDVASGASVVAPIADAYVWSGNRATRNYGSKKQLVLRNFNNKDRKAILRFDLSDQHENISAMSKATLRLHVEDVGTQPSRSVTVMRLAEAPFWDETSVTWTSLLDVEAQEKGPSFIVSSGDADTWVEADISDLARTHEGTTLVLMLEITSPSNSGSRCVFSSREMNAFSPQLVITPGDNFTPDPTIEPTPKSTTAAPTEAPTSDPSNQPSAVPSSSPSAVPSTSPSEATTEIGDEWLTNEPTSVPTESPTPTPTNTPTENEITDPIFQLGTPMLRGTGCPSSDSVGVMSTPDGSKVTVMFMDYWAETDASVGATRVRKNCALSIPVKVLPGYSIGIFQADYRGYVDVPDVDGFEASFNAEYFFAGTWGERKSTTWDQGSEGDFTLTDHVGAVTMSRCGDEEHNLRINTSIVAKGRGSDANDSVLIQIDSGDFTNPFSAHIPLDELGPRFSFGIKTDGCSNRKLGGLRG